MLLYVNTYQAINLKFTKNSCSLRDTNGVENPRAAAAHSRSKASSGGPGRTSDLSDTLFDDANHSLIQ